MRIGTYTMVNQVYGTRSSGKSKSTNGTSNANFKDEVSFSSTGKDMQVAKNALAGVSDVRESRVSELKAKMADGTYEVSSDAFADKLISAFASKKLY